MNEWASAVVTVHLDRTRLALFPFPSFCLSSGYLWCKVWFVVKELNSQNHWNICLRHDYSAALWLYLLVAAAAAAAAAVPPAWAGEGTVVPPGCRQQGRWLAEKKSGWAENMGEAGRTLQTHFCFLEENDRAATPPADLLKLEGV